MEEEKGLATIDNNTTVLSREEIITTPEEINDDYIQIQGSDRKYPAIVIRKRHRGKGATSKTISKFGQHSEIYGDYEAAIRRYSDNRAKRLGQHPDKITETKKNSDNTQDNRQDFTTLGSDEGGVIATRESWLSKTLQSVVEEKRRDNSS